MSSVVATIGTMNVGEYVRSVLSSDRLDLESPERLLKVAAVALAVELERAL